MVVSIFLHLVTCLNPSLSLSSSDLSFFSLSRITCYMLIFLARLSSSHTCRSATLSLASSSLDLPVLFVFHFLHLLIWSLYHSLYVQFFLSSSCCESITLLHLFFFLVDTHLLFCKQRYTKCYSLPSLKCCFIQVLLPSLATNHLTLCWRSLVIRYHIRFEVLNKPCLS